jgi:TRAP-type C4-dicarboxylate transport system permease large subunit
MNVFVMKAFAKDVPVMTIFAGVWPFIAALIIGIVLIIAFPPLTYWLPNLIMGA